MSSCKVVPAQQNVLVFSKKTLRYVKGGQISSPCEPRHESVTCAPGHIFGVLDVFLVAWAAWVNSLEAMAIIFSYSLDLQAPTKDFSHHQDDMKKCF